MNKYIKAFQRVVLDAIESEIIPTEKIPHVSALRELVEKATPKFISCPKGFQGMRGTRFKCPSCNKMLEFREYTYCKHCGQALKYPKLKNIDNKLVYDWSDEE